MSAMAVNQYGTFPVYATVAQRENARRTAARDYQKRARGDSVTVTCPGCSAPRTVQERQARRIAGGEHSGLCVDCRFPRAATLRPDAYYSYWLERFTLDEIRELAAGIDDSDSPNTKKPAERSLTEALLDGLPTSER